MSPLGLVGVWGRKGIYLGLDTISYYMKMRPKKYIRKPFNISLAIENDIVPAIKRLIDRTNAVYCDDVQREIPQYTKNAISFWLRTNGFVKPMGQNSKRWVKTIIKEQKQIE